MAVTLLLGAMLLVLAPATTFAEAMDSSQHTGQLVAHQTQLGAAALVSFTARATGNHTHLRPEQSRKAALSMTTLILVTRPGSLHVGQLADT